MYFDKLNTQRQIIPILRTMTRFRLPLVFQFLIFLIPLNIYMWGDWLLVDVQWALFRYQQSGYGNSLILGHKDMVYIFLGQTTGLYNIIAALSWTVGAAILLIGLCITVLAFTREESGKIKTASYYTLSGGLFLGLSAICRFLGGFAIPVGVPIILIIGWWMFQEYSEPDKTNGENHDEEISAQNNE